MNKLTFSIAIAFSLAKSVPAYAVTVLNTDSETRTLTVTEKGVRAELSIDANAKVTTCSDGCFIAFPSGDMIAVKGTEEIIIEGGKGRIVNN